MAIMAALTVHGWQSPGHCYRPVPRISTTARKGCSIQGFLKDTAFLLKTSKGDDELHLGLMMKSLGGGHGNVLIKNKTRIHVMSPEISPPSFAVEFLDAWDDEYGGIVVDANSLPSSANAFASALRASLTDWKLKGKKGIWLKILSEQAELIPIAIKEGFDYHHAEPGYAMLTYWIPDGPCMLPDSPSHQIGVGAFVINEKREVLVVKEKCPCNCSGVWKMPTGYINKSEDIFSGAIREVKEETGVDTIFLKLVAFRHAHLVAFEKSDLLFVCMLKPLSSEITIDEKEIQAAKWMPVDEYIGQPFYEEDDMSRKVIEACIAEHEGHYNGFAGRRLTSKLDGKLSYLYYDCSSSF